MNVQVNMVLIKELRIRRSWSQERLADIVGVNLRTIQRIEKNGVASLQTRAALAEVLGLRPEDLDVPAATDSAAPRGPWPSKSFAVILTITLAALFVILAIAAKSAAVWVNTGTGGIGVIGLFGLAVLFSGFTMLARSTDLSRWRPYFVSAMIVIGLLIMPPVWFAPVLLVALLWAMFELSLASAKLFPVVR